MDFYLLERVREVKLINTWIFNVPLLKKHISNHFYQGFYKDIDNTSIHYKSLSNQ